MSIERPGFVHCGLGGVPDLCYTMLPSTGVAVSGHCPLDIVVDHLRSLSVGIPDIRQQQEDFLEIITTEQAENITALVDEGHTDFDIAQQIAAGDDPELLLDGVSVIREAHEAAQLG